MYKEADAIRLEGESRANYGMSCQLLVKGQWLKPYRLDLWHLHRDYVKGFGDAVVIEMMMGMGTYTYQLIPNRDDLQVELVFTPMAENSDKQRTDTRVTTVRLRAILMEQDNQALVGRHSQATDEETLNLANYKQVQLQLVSEATYKARLQSVGRGFRKMSPMDVLRTLLTESVAMFGGKDADRIQGIASISPGFNTEVRNQIEIPHGTRLPGVCDLLQNKEGGLYPTGAGAYLQDNFWYIYSLYDTAQFKKAKKTLTVLNVPKNRYYGTERTYRVQGDALTILVAGDASALDTSFMAKLNAGNGFRVADARKLFDFGIVKDNKMLIDRATNVFEVVTDQMKNGLNNVAWSADRATSNPYKHYTDQAARQGQQVKVEWQHGDSDLILPGMPVKFLTTDKDQLRTYYGRVHEVDEQRAPAEAGANASRYPGMVTLSLFLTPSQDPLDQPT
jgi:hypothetical protein